ncbi:hypothetical protein [Nonomuraea sp. SYSU D8015]|uniref:hypothetical protein n=1 Tax=Nonomuraea sp. SYSU D8015 TaxID=2593644 RepID=UPI0016607C30|nr:hypothetical protein [Nonomuraea sp. SYSU D8015]
MISARRASSVPQSQTFAIVVRDGRVVDAAPIARWAVGKPEQRVSDYYRRKGALNWADDPGL